MTAGSLGYTEGTGAEVLVDAVTISAIPGNVQFTKLVDGTVGGTDPIHGTTARGLMVEPVQLRRTITVTPTLDTSIYAALDSLFTTPAAFANAGRTSVGTGIIQSLVVVDKSASQRSPMDLFFFTADPSNGTYTANSPLNLTDTDAALYVGKVSIASGDYQTAFPTPANSLAEKHGLAIPYDLSSGTSLYMLGRVITNTPTYGATDLTFKLTCQVD